MAPRQKSLLRSRNLSRGVGERNQPPIVKYNILTSPGVSGYQTTGQPGNFNFQLHRPIEVVQNVDSSTSGFDWQNRQYDPQQGRTTEEYNLPGIDYTTPSPNVGANIVTPTVVSTQSSLVLSSRGVTQDLQAGLVVPRESFMNDLIEQGAFQFDPTVQALITDDLEPVDAVHGDFYTPVGSRHSSVPPSPGIRQNMLDGSGTINPTYNIQIQGVDTQQGNYSINRIQQHTPALVNTSNATPATHPSHAEGIGPGHPGGINPGTFNLMGVITQNQSNPYPYLDLGMPPQPMELIPGATGMLTDKAASQMRDIPGVQVQFEL